MTETEQQILINQIMIMEAMIHNFHQSNDYDCVCRNLELQASATYDLLKKNRENEDKRLTYQSRDGWICYKDHKSPNIMNVHDIKARCSLDEACTIIHILLGKLADYEAIGTVEEIKRQLELAVDVYDNSERLINTTMDMLMEYQQIGTIEEFKALKDTEAQGLLLRPKCRLGDVVYALWSIPTESKYVVYPAEVKEINLSSTNARKMIMYKLEPIAFRGRYNKYYDDDFGKLVFMSQEEADLALENM